MDSLKIKIIVGTVILTLGVTLVVSYLVLQNGERYGLCPGGGMSITKAYLPKHDQVISPNSKNYFHHPYSAMGDVIPKDRALFIAFATYSPANRAITTIAFLRDRLIQEQGPFAGDFNNTRFDIDRDISILFPSIVSLNVGEPITLHIHFQNANQCIWRGVVQQG